MDGQNGTDGANGANGDNGRNGADGANGEDGRNGADGLTSLLVTSPESVGSNCPDGGQRVDVGIDDDRSGTLESSEVDQTTYVCNGADGANGADGQNGADGMNGSDGATCLVSVSPEDPGLNCSEGGQRIDNGVDDDNSGILDRVICSCSRRLHDIYYKSTLGT